MQSDDYLHIKKTDSTNKLMWELLKKEDLAEGFIIHTDYQTAGRGQSTNSWESAKGKNLLFSLLLKPLHIPINEQFRISQLCSNGIIYVLRTMFPEEAPHFSIKWPNDIYWKEKKLGGILIEHKLQGNKIINSVLGIGLNINQTKFLSDAPNPISIKQITNKKQDIQTLLFFIVEKILEYYAESEKQDMHQFYMDNLFWKEGLHPFIANGVSFNAHIANIQADGQLILKDESGNKRAFYFKEVEWYI